ncbi:MAG: PEP-CTERM sorting domain-containing protein [Deltaproteobacteria bacterium]|nr:PEP-CTERM sorting domain-containing protein [Deltaproteobacteria bacterium]
MKGFIKTALMISSIMMLIAGTAFADIIIPFTDNAPPNYWPGYSNGTSDDSKETIGEPDISGGQIVLTDSGYLKEVSFFFTEWGFRLMKPGDLFLNTDSDPEWDYVMSLYNRTDGSNTAYDSGSNSRYIPTTPYGTVPLYAVEEDALLLLTDTDNSGYWSGYLLRNNHPFAYTGMTGTPIGSGSVSGGFENNSPLTFTLPTDTLLITDYLAIGFAQNCANDPVYETVVPEPSTLIFLGSGLLLLGGYLRKKRS